MNGINPSEPVEVDELDLALGGIWTVHSTSSTIYRLDLDSRMLRREPGTRSSPAPGDFQWVFLTQVHSLSVGDDDKLTVDPDQRDVITVGRRHLYMLSPPPETSLTIRWWLQRIATRIIQRAAPGAPTVSNREA